MRDRFPRQKAPNLTEKAYELIREAIVDGEFPPGTLLHEFEMKRRFKIGRTPLREACSRLCFDQLLEVVPRHGYYVPELGLRAIRNLFELRLLIERACAELAAIRADARDLRELDKAEKKSLSLAKKKDAFGSLLKANTEFHLAIAQATHNEELVKLVERILARTQIFTYQLFPYSDFPGSDLHAYHKPIVDAIRRHDSASAKRAVADDVEHDETYILGGDRSKSNSDHNLL
jgi:DNA-binding GntR family transcriptional regulator